MFYRVEERIDELSLHFERIQDQLHVLYKVISFNDMQIDPIMTGGNVAYESGYLFYENDDLLVLMRKCPFYMIMSLEWIVNLKRKPWTIHI